MSTARADFDVVIIGAGLAGSAAALAAQRHELRSLVIEKATEPPPTNCAGWLGPAAVGLCRDNGVDLQATGAEFRGLRFFSWDCRRSAEVKDAELTGWMADPGTLNRTLLEAARQAGAALERPAEVEQIQLGESQVVLRLSTGRAVTGQVLLIADGAAAQTARRIGIPAVLQVPQVASRAHATLDAPAPTPRLDVVLGAAGGLKVATIAQGPAGARVTLWSRAADVPAVQELPRLLRAARAARLLPDGPEIAHPSPHLGGAALELDTHVGKRLLLIGDAGGFVSALSDDGAYPAMRSGWLAVETVVKALQAPVLQDELASFSARWRADLADYLRMPNTDLSLLLPMILDNAQMCRRAARGFLLGQGL